MLLQLSFDGCLFLLWTYLFNLLLHLILPSFEVRGYCCDDETCSPLKYRLNGPLVHLVTSLLYWFVFPLDYQTLLYREHTSCLFMANIIGLGTSLFMFLRGGRVKYSRCLTTDQVQLNNRTGKYEIKDSAKSQLSPDESDKLNAGAIFFLGREWNPRFFGKKLDMKMWLYIVGAVGLQLNIFSCLQAQRFGIAENGWNGETSRAMACYCFCFTWFLVEYLLGEKVHLYTYDLFAEKIGFKLIWGCLFFYPFFYNIGAHSLVIPKTSGDISVTQTIAIIALFFFGWSITRGANMQKYYYRINPEDKYFLFGLVKQECIPGTRILCSGWWGVARHFNYLGEIVQGLALALPGVIVGETTLMKCLPLLYPLYYIILFVTRQIDDDVVCSKKYGKKWDEYVQRVPYRIFPGVW